MSSQRFSSAERQLFCRTVQEGNRAFRGSYLMEQRIEAAKDLLRYSELSQAEIGATLAFSSQSHFIHAFKRAVGVTPGQFRRRAELID